MINLLDEVSIKRWYQKKTTWQGSQMLLKYQLVFLPIAAMHCWLVFCLFVWNYLAFSFCFCLKVQTTSYRLSQVLHPHLEWVVSFASQQEVNENYHHQEKLMRTKDDAIAAIKYDRSVHPNHSSETTGTWILVQQQSFCKARLQVHTYCLRRNTNMMNRLTHGMSKWRDTRHHHLKPRQLRCYNATSRLPVDWNWIVKITLQTDHLGFG